jgi:hypothetical protein
VIKLDAVEFVLEGPHGLAVCFHLVVVAARVLHDLVDHKLRIPPHVEALDAYLDAILRPQSRASYSAMLFDAGKWRRIAYRMCSPRGDTKSRPAPAPVFITEPSKYRVQHFA